jgi:hypothetical protein
LGFIEEAIEIAGSGLTLVPEFYLLKGDLLLALPEANGTSAESWFQRASDAAHVRTDPPPIRVETSASIRACARTRTPSRRTSVSSSARSLPTNELKSILLLAIAPPLDVCSTPMRMGDGLFNSRKVRGKVHHVLGR